MLFSCWKKKNEIKTYAFIKVKNMKKQTRLGKNILNTYLTKDLPLKYVKNSLKVNKEKNSTLKNEQKSTLLAAADEMVCWVIFNTLHTQIMFPRVSTPKQLQLF